MEPEHHQRGRTSSAPWLAPPGSKIGLEMAEWNLQDVLRVLGLIPGHF